MLYKKMPVVFLSTLDSEKTGSTNANIATYILEHYDEIQDIGIKELANRCHVAVSSVSRFCKEIGLQDYLELKELINTNELYFQSIKDTNNIAKEYTQQVKDSLDLAISHLNYQKVIELCKDIHTYNKVATFGMLKAEGVAVNLQSDLLMMGKHIYTNVAYNEQMDYILNTDENDLLIIFSYTGAYFDYKEFRALRKNLQKPKIWMITSKQNSYPDFVDEVIDFTSKQDQISHPYQLQLIAGIIAQEYSKYSS